MAVYFNNTVPWYTDIIKEGGKAALTELIKGMFARDAAARTQRLDEAQWQKDWNNIQSQPDQMSMTIQSSPETMENAARAEGLLSGLSAAAADAENSSITPKTVFEDVKPITAPGYEGKTISPDGNSITTDNNGILGLTYKANDYDLKNLDSRMAILNRLAKGNNGKAVSKANFKSLYDYIYGANQNDIKINEAQKRYDAVTSKYGPISSSNADPSSALVMMAMMGDKDAAGLYQDQLSKENNTTFDTVDLGGRKVVLANNAYKGTSSPVQSFGVTMTPQQFAEYKLKQSEEARKQQNYAESKTPFLSRPMAWLNSDDAKARFGAGYDPSNPTRDQIEAAIQMTARTPEEAKTMRAAFDPRGEWAMQDRITEAGMIADALGKQGGILTPEQRMAAGLAKDAGGVASTSISAKNKEEAAWRREQFKAQSKEFLENLRLDAEKGNHAAELAYKQYAADLDAITKKEIAILRSETETGVVNTKARAELDKLRLNFIQGMEKLAAQQKNAVELENIRQAGHDRRQERQIAKAVLITDMNNKAAFELKGLDQDTALRLAKINQEGRIYSAEVQKLIANENIKAQTARQLAQNEHDKSKQESEHKHQLQMQANKAQYDSEALYYDFAFKSLILQQKGNQDKKLEEYKAAQKQDEYIARMQHEKDLLEMQLNSQEGRFSAELQHKYASKKQELEEAQRNRDHARDQLVTQLAGAQILQEMKNRNSVTLAQMGIDSQQTLADLRATVDREVLKSQEYRHLQTINAELQKMAQSGKQFTEDQQRRKKEAEDNLLLKQQQLENNYLKTHYGFLMDKYKSDINVEMRRDIAALTAASRAQIASDKNASNERIAEGRNQTAEKIAAIRANSKSAGSGRAYYSSSAELNANLSAISQARNTSEGIDSATFALRSIPDPESRAAFSTTLIMSPSLIVHSGFHSNGTPTGDASNYTNPVYYKTIAKDNGLSPDQADSFLNKAKIVVKDSANNPDLPADLLSAYIELIKAYKKRKGNREQTSSAKIRLPLYGMN